MGLDQNPKLAVEAGSDEDSSGHEVYASQKPVSKFTRWYRSPLFNVIIVGLISFTQPGIWNALNNTGAGGQQEPYLVNGANSLTFGLVISNLPCRKRTASLTRSQQDHGLWMSVVRHSRLQIWPEKYLNYWYTGVCTIFGFSVCQQSLWNRMVCALWWCHVWDSSFGTMGFGRSNCTWLCNGQRSREVQYVFNF